MARSFSASVISSKCKVTATHQTRSYIGEMTKWAAALCFSAVFAHAQSDPAERYRKELERNQSSSEAHFWLGERLLEQKKWMEARQGASAGVNRRPEARLDSARVW
jgi:TolA-binding protein